MSSQHQSDITTRIAYNKFDRDYTCYATIDGVEQIIGVGESSTEAEGICRDYRFNHYSDNHTPEKAAQVAAETFDSDAATTDDPALLAWAARLFDVDEPAMEANIGRRVRFLNPTCGAERDKWEIWFVQRNYRGDVVYRLRQDTNDTFGRIGRPEALAFVDDSSGPVAAQTKPPTVIPNPGLHLTTYTLVMSGPDEPFTSMTLTLCDSCAAGRRNLSKRGECINGSCDGCGAGPSVGHFRLADEPPTPTPPTLDLPPINVLAEVAAELATAAQDAGDTANMHALNKAMLQLHAGTVPVPTTGGFLVESRARVGVVHRVSTVHGCSCESGSKGRACWHCATIELIVAAQRHCVEV